MRNRRGGNLREELLAQAKERYGVSEERLWAKYPEYVVLRHAHNRKWFALFMTVDRKKLGLPGEGRIDILDLKAEPDVALLLSGTPGYLPGYHMHKGNWMTVLLDGTVAEENILPLLERSFELTGGGRSGASSGKRITSWLIPANPAYYDIEGALRENPEEPFLWKQSSRVAAGDTVYLYLTAPVRAVRYKCRVLEADLAYAYADRNLSIKRAMRLQLLEQYAPDFLTAERLREHGVFAVRGPRSMPESLTEELAWHERGN